jgi:hypothetical protein
VSVATASGSRFDANASDAARLLDIHTRVGGPRAGRRDAALQALNRAGLILVCAVWQVYCEDVVAEARERLARASAEAIPASRRVPPAPALTGENGWHAAASREVDALFADELGLARVSDGWYWTGMSAARAREKLDQLIVLRGDVARRRAMRVRRREVAGLLNHTRRLAAKTDACVEAFLVRTRDAGGARPG